MTTRKTLHVPVSSDGVPVATGSPSLDKTRELSADQIPKLDVDNPDQLAAAMGTPTDVIDQEVTVPVHSSIESTLTFEMLRRQSREDEGHEDEHHEDDRKGNEDDPKT
jgi:hypothetical protein